MHSSKQYTYLLLCTNLRLLIHLKAAQPQEMKVLITDVTTVTSSVSLCVHSAINEWLEFSFIINYCKVCEGRDEIETMRQKNIGRIDRKMQFVNENYKFHPQYG